MTGRRGSFEPRLIFKQTILCLVVSHISSENTPAMPTFANLFGKIPQITSPKCHKSLRSALLIYILLL